MYHALLFFKNVHYIVPVLYFFFIVFQVKLLKDILEAWKREVEKKPPTMSIEDALEVLKLPKIPEG